MDIRRRTFCCAITNHMNSAFVSAPVLHGSHQLGVQSLSFHNAFFTRGTIRPARRARWQSSLIAVVGATGGVGRLLVDRLLHSVNNDPNSLSTISTPSQFHNTRVTGIRVLTRNIVRSRTVLPTQNPALTLQQIPPLGIATKTELEAALKGVAVLAICTGTTAFPTRSWRNGNTPSSVDDKGVLDLVRAVDQRTIERIVLMSSIGTKRVSQFPFTILNSFGVLDAKRKGERHVEGVAKEMGISYAIVRPGRLLGAPHTNVGMLRSEPHPKKLDVEITRGDVLSGDLSRSVAADAMYIATMWDTASDLDFSIVHSAGVAPHLDSLEQKLKGVQIPRRKSGMQSRQH